MHLLTPSSVILLIFTSAVIGAELETRYEWWSKTQQAVLRALSWFIRQ